MFPSQLRASTQRGFFLIGLLIVFVIIAILYGKQLLPDKNGPGQLSYIDRSKGAACSVNRSTLTTTITTWGISHPGVPVTIENLQKSNVNVPTCPEHGIYEIGPDNTVYCSKHFPRPEAAATPEAQQQQPAGSQSQQVPTFGGPRTIATPAPTPDITAE